jgi:hypothetical protein
MEIPANPTITANPDPDPAAAIQARAINKALIPSPAAGLDFILSHFHNQEIWPRTISTRTIGGKQIVINSQEEALARFAQANWLDCRISAYPPNAMVNPSAVERFQGLTWVTPRNMVVIIDLDKYTFKSDKALQLALTRTLQKIKSILGVESPTIIWSGNGYHIYLVMDSEGIVLENIKDLSDLTDNVSLKFLRFVEWFLSNGKSDRVHNSTVSFNNCMLRIPGSYNSKNKCQVRIINYRESTPATPAIHPPSIKPLLRDFRRYLIDQQLKEFRQEQHKQQPLPSSSISNNSIYWIEQLIKTPIDDHRKYCIWRILTPYLLNIRKLSEQQCYDIIKEWLESCSKLRRLDFNPKMRIKDGLESSKEGYLPISFDKLREENPKLLSLLF